MLTMRTDYKDNKNDDADVDDDDGWINDKLFIWAYVFRASLGVDVNMYYLLLLSHCSGAVIKYKLNDVLYVTTTRIVKWHLAMIEGQGNNKSFV